MRDHLVGTFDLPGFPRILEVGCGSGAILQEMRNRIPGGRFHGLDIRLEHLLVTGMEPPSTSLVLADAFRLPYPATSFDLVYSHFLFLWLGDPVSALAEMKRVTRPGGWVLALAEPDYGGRIDHPAELARLGRMQEDALSRQGADPCAGRKLRGWFNQIDLQQVRSGILGAEWVGSMNPDAMKAEWEVVRSDLEGILSAEELESFQQIDAGAWSKGERVLFVPTFYAVGQVIKERVPKNIAK